MPYPSTLNIGPLSQISAAAPSGPAQPGTAPRPAPDILTYCYASRMVYVTPGDTYDVRPIPILPLRLAFFTDYLYAFSTLLNSPRSLS